MSKSADSDDFPIPTVHDHLAEGFRECMENLIKDHGIAFDLKGRDFDKLWDLSREMADELERLVLLRFVRFLLSLGKQVPEGWEKW